MASPDKRFPEYEEEGTSSGATTKRCSYFLAGQLLAVRVKTDSSDTLYFTFADHLGNVSAITYSGGTLVAGSLARYEPFGGFRTEPTSNPAITDRGFTGHKHNNTGTYDIGLVYMNARYYLPEIGRFISADTIVPDPQDPQSYNRYSYVLNNPLQYTDPTGHCEGSPNSGDDSDCWDFAYHLRDGLGLDIGLLGLLNLEQLRFFEQSINSISNVHPAVTNQVIDLLNESIAHNLVGYMVSGGWDVLGVRLGFGASGFLGGDIAFDFMFNFSGLEFSIQFGLTGSAGPQGGSSLGGGVYLGYNAPTNDAFLGWGSTLGGTIAVGPGVTVQAGFSGKQVYLGSAIPDHKLAPTDPWNLAVMITPGVEAGFGIGPSYTWNLYTSPYQMP